MDERNGGEEWRRGIVENGDMGEKGEERRERERERERERRGSHD
jgi:hypothetical protein